MCVNLSDNYIICEQMLEQHSMEIIYIHAVFQFTFLNDFKLYSAIAAAKSFKSRTNYRDTRIFR